MLRKINHDMRRMYIMSRALSWIFLIVATFAGPKSWGQTYYNMSSGNYSQNFADIANWTNNYASGIGANNWKVASSATGSTINNTTVFSTGTAGGVQKGTQSLIILATGTNSAATDLLLNFSNRIVGDLSLNWSKVANTADANPRSSDLKIQYSTDGGNSFVDMTGYTIPRILNNSNTESGILNIPLPSALNNQNQVIIRFFVWNNSQAGGSGNRPKWQLDDISISSTGNTCTTPSTQPTTFTSNNITTNTANINFTRGNGTGGVLVIGRAGSAVVTAPTNGTTYNANTSFGNGDAIGSGFVVYNGTAAGASNPTGNISLTNLTANTTYHFAAYEYNSIDNCYNLSNALTGSLTTLASEPTTQPNSLAFTNVTASGFTLGWTNGNGSNRIVLIKANGAVDATPTDATAYTANTTFASGTQIGTGNYVVFNGTANSVNVTGLSANTTYHVAVYEFNGSSSSINYLTTSPLTGSRSSLVTAPSTAASAVSVGAKTSNSITLNWTNGNGSNRIVVARTSGTSATTPTNGTNYTVNSNSFADATNPTTATGRVVVYNGNTNTTTITGLNAATSYSFDVYEYNGNGLTSNYSAASSITSQYTLSTEPTQHAASFTAQATTATNINLSFSAANTLPASGYLLLKKASAFVIGDYPVDGNAYNVGSTIGENGATVNTIVTNNTITTSTGTNVSADLTVHYLLVPFNWDGTNTSTRNYFTSGSIPTVNVTTPSGSSDAVAVVGSEPATISSLINDEAPLTSTTGAQVWQFTIRDGGSSLNDADNLPTKISSITLTQNAGNSVSTWNTSIKTVALFDGNTLLATGTVGNPTNNITFSGLSLIIPDGQSKTLTVRLSLKNTLGTTDDGKDFVFNLTNANIATSTDGTSSGVASFAAINSSTADNIIAVVATKLDFVQQPTNVNIWSAINPAVTLEAVDANGNRDIDYNTTISLTSTGILNTSPQTATPTSGLATFNNIVHTKVGSAIQLTAASGTLTSAVSNTIDVLLAPLQFAEWKFTTVNTDTNNPKISVSAISRGNNNGTTNPNIDSTSASSGYAGASGFGNAGAAARAGSLDTHANGSAYFEFTITPNQGYKVELTNISFGNRSTGTGPLAYTLRSSIDNYTTDIFTGTLLNNGNWALTSNSTAINVLVDLGQSVTFRIYGYNGTGSPGTNTTNWRIDDLKLSGYITDPVFYSKTVGNINDLSTWGMNTDGTGTAPTSFSMDGAAYILANRTNPEIPSNWAVTGTLDLKDNILNIGSNTLTVNGNITRTTGTIKTNEGTIILGGSVSSTLYFDQTTDGTTNKLKDLTINRSGATVALGNKLQLAQNGTITVTAGTLNTNGYLVLTSTAADTTARIATLPPGATVSGNVEIQRYINGGVGYRGWRYMSSPVANATYAQLIDDIFITGPGGATNGFDVAGNTSSVMTYEEGANRGWKNISSPNNTWATGKGAIVFFRGDRTQTSSITNTNVAPNSFALDFNGTINSGSYNVNLDYDNTVGVSTNQGWNLIGNPYPSQIDWDLVTKTSGVNSHYYLINPNSKNYMSANTGIIAIGQGFFVQVNASGQSVTFNETNKTGVNGTAYFKTATNPLTIKMNLDSVQNDIAKIFFLNGANKNYLFTEDAVKLSNTVYNLSLVTPNSVDVQNSYVPPLGVTGTDTFELKVTSTTNTTYSLSFENLQSLPINRAVLLIDKMNNSITNMRVTPNYTFAINNTQSSSFGKRFLLIITDQQNPLPIKLTHFSGVNQGEYNRLSWTTASEKNLIAFELQKATDDLNFESIGLIKANNRNTTTHYNFSDNQAYCNKNFYRLKLIYSNYNEYSNTIVLSKNEINNQKQVIEVYPNPANNILNIKSADGETIDDFSIFDFYGKLVLNAAKTDVIDISGLEDGNYILQVEMNGRYLKTKFSKMSNR